MAEGNIELVLHISEKLHNELKIAAKRDNKTIEELVVSVLFDADVADME